MYCTYRYAMHCTYGIPLLSCAVSGSLDRHLPRIRSTVNFASLDPHAMQAVLHPSMAVVRAAAAGQWCMMHFASNQRRALAVAPQRDHRGIWGRFLIPWDFLGRGHRGWRWYSYVCWIVLGLPLGCSEQTNKLEVERERTGSLSDPFPVCRLGSNSIIM